MTVPASKLYSLPLHYLRQTLAASSTFQTVVGAADAAAALASIHVISAASATPPFAVVDWAENFRRTAESESAGSQFVGEGDLLLLLRFAISSEHDDADAGFTFANALGGIIADMEAVAGTPGYLDITEITMDQRLARPGDDEAEQISDFYQAVLRISFWSA